ncbi:MAG: HAD family hydrolase [Leptospira sp.]|nr:HAD family hydrolase [Leptospira sp.]
MSFLKKYWVFDMDGTLTCAKHDFPAIKTELGLPLDKDILTGLSFLNPIEREKKNLILEKIELEIAKISTPQIGAFELLTHLKNLGVRLGILTRNSLINTIVTLEVTNLLSFFPESEILTRDHAEPKPHPEGLFKLQNHWQADPNEMIMVGDYLYDLLAGKSASTDTIYIDPTGEFKFKEHATHCIKNLFEAIDLDLIK